MPAMDTTALHAAARHRAHELRNAAFADLFARLRALVLRRRSP